MAKQVMGHPGVLQYSDYRTHLQPVKRMGGSEEDLQEGYGRHNDMQEGQSSDEECLDMRNQSRPPAAKKTKGRVKIKMEFIDNKLRRYTTFSKRKTGIMKKAYELSTLTGTQVMLLVASETGHVYTFATRKLQPMITSEAGKALIQTCLNSPDPPPEPAAGDQRMSATGYEETELNYNIAEEEEEGRDENDEENEEGEDDTREGSVDTRDESLEPEERKPNHPIFSAPGLSVFPSHHPPSSLPEHSPSSHSSHPPSSHSSHPPTSHSIHPSSHPAVPSSSHPVVTPPQWLPHSTLPSSSHHSPPPTNISSAHKSSVSTSWKLQEGERRFGVNIEKRDSIALPREPVAIAPKLARGPDKNGAGMFVETRDGVVYAPTLASLPPHILAHFAAANGSFKSQGAPFVKASAGASIKTEEAKDSREET